MNAPAQTHGQACYLNGYLVSAIATDFGGTITLDEFDHVAGDRAVDPDAAVTLGVLHQHGLPLILASNTTPGERRWPALQRAGIDKLFKVALLSASLGPRKPTPEFFDLVTAAAKVPPEQVLVVGDNIRCDIQGPLDYGMQAALVRPGGLRSGEEVPGGVPVIRHVRELPALLGIEVTPP